MKALNQFSPFLVVLFFTLPVLAKTNKVVKRRPASNPQLASIGPAVPILRKEDMIKFVECPDEQTCLEQLQGMELGLSENESESPDTIIAEFVEKPKRGIVVYRKR